MKVDNFMILSKSNISIDKELAREGDILEGLVIGFMDDTAIIDIENLGIFKAYLEDEVDLHEGMTSKFLVKRLLSDRMELKLLPNNMDSDGEMKTLSGTANYLKDLLTEFNIEDDQISVDFLETLIKYNVRLSKDDVIKGIKILDKLEELLNIRPDDKIKLVNSNKDLDIGKVDIVNLIIENKEEMDGGRDFTSIVNKYLSKMNCLEDNLMPSLVKIVGFLIKFNMKPNLNNIRYLLKLMEDPLSFSEDFKTLGKIFGKKFTNLIKKVNIDKGSYSISLGESGDRLKQILLGIEGLTKTDNLLDDKGIEEVIKELNDKIEFMDDINKELSFIYLPLDIDEGGYKGILTFFKEKRKRHGLGERLNIFINLQTSRLGNIKIFCQLLDLSINIKFSNVAKEDYHLFKSEEEFLRDMVESTGYRVGKVEYLFMDCYSLLDALVVNEKSVYSLDIKV
ncbi:MAG TPA: hypothetical protein GXX70_04515 [Tepidimicrobium sp.]|nr:hypothetical protein [Tepidimicrobium sp.]